MQDDIEARVRAVIIDCLGVDDAKLVSETELGKDLGADSLDAIELMMVLEDEFDCTITDSEAGKVIIVADAITLIRAKTK